MCEALVTIAPNIRYVTRVPKVLAALWPSSLRVTLIEATRAKDNPSQSVAPLALDNWRPVADIVLNPSCPADSALLSFPFFVQWSLGI